MLFARSVGIRATINRETTRTGDSTMSGILQDVRFALRGFRNSPGVAAVAILTLALGVGANTAVFSIVDGVLLKALPYPDPDRMVRIYSSWEQSDRGNVLSMDFLDRQDQESSFSAVAAATSEDYAHIGTGEPEVVFAAEVTPGFFEVAAVDTALGRPFVGDDGGPRADPVVVLSNGSWQRSFGSDPDVIGRSLRLETGSATIVGVMPPGFVSPGWSDTGPDFWINMVLDRADNNRGGHFLGVIGRLREDVQLTSARSEMDKIGRDLAELYPRKLALDGDPPLLMTSVRERIWAHDPLLPLRDVYPMKDRVRASVAVPRFIAALPAMFAILAMVLAAVGIYGIVSYGVTERYCEIGIRLTLGAESTAIIRMVVLKGLLPTLIGIGLGLGAALFGASLAQDVLFGVSATDPVSFGAVPVGLLVIATVASYVPARRAVRVDPLTTLKYE
jgi:putative ABC transport system permease protein